MRPSRLLAAVALIFAGAHSACAVAAEKSDQEMIQGTWVATELVINGKEVPEAERQAFRLTFVGDVMRLMAKQNINEKEFKFTLDPTQSPKAIDAVSLGGAFKGVKIPAIYAFDGDTLKVCIPDNETKERPTEFKSSEVGRLVLFTLKRLKE